MFVSGGLWFGGPFGWYSFISISQARALQIGVSQATIDLLIASNLGTLGKYAYCCKYQPNAADEQPLIDCLSRVLGAAPNDGVLSPLRRLFYEAHTVCMLEMRNRFETREGDVPRKMQIPERVYRMAQLRNRYPGLLIRGELEFSYQLLD